MNIGATFLLQEPFAKAFGKNILQEHPMLPPAANLSVTTFGHNLQTPCGEVHGFSDTPVALSIHKSPNRLGGVEKYGDKDVSVLRSVWYLQTPVALCRHETPNRMGGVHKSGDKDVSVLRSVWYLQTPVALCGHDTPNGMGGVQKYRQMSSQVL